MSLEETIKNNPVLMIGSALVAGFSAGIAAFWFVLSASSTDLVDHGAYVSMAELREWIPADDLDERGYIHESDVERSYVLRTECEETKLRVRAAEKEANGVTLPVTLDKSILLACNHRGGSQCFAADGSVLTPPPDSGIAFARFSVPSGARHFLATLNEYSGTSCSGGNASAQVLVDGQIVLRFEVNQATSQAVNLALPPEAKVLELTASADGDSAWCDDVQWTGTQFAS